ncbi:MAG: hypothetical protein E7056_01890 [Lentisphaerae bacterium]|nr:hypothetical protein [Lentisphaerota bacterium]
MNKARRKTLEEIREALGGLMLQVNELAEAEQEAFDNLPESLQETERGEAMQAAIDNLDSLRNSLEEAGEYIEDITNA